MPPAIHKVVLVFVCLACVNEGHQARTSTERLQRRAVAMSQTSVGFVNSSRSSGRIGTKQKALSALLLAFNGRIAFHPSGQGALLPVSHPTRVNSHHVVAERWNQVSHRPLRRGRQGAVAQSPSLRLPPASRMPRLARPRMTAQGSEFDPSIAAWAAGWAFEAYNQPSEQDARWERGADGIDVAFMSKQFAQEVYSGILEVRLCEAKDLEEQQELAQKLVSGSQRDAYVVIAMNEEKEDGPKEGAIGLGRAVDVQRSSTVWSKSLIDQLKDGTKGSTLWPDNETLYLYVKDPARAQLALTVFDEEVLADDVALGATSLHMADYINPEGTPQERKWSGWVPLTWRPEEVQDGAVTIGVVAGAALAGPVGAAAGGLVGSLIKKPVQGELRLELKYTPLTSATLEDDGDGTSRVADSSDPTSEAFIEEDVANVEAGTEETNVQAEAGTQEQDAESSTWTPVLTSGAAPKGGSEGVDWSILGKRVGSIGVDEREDFELCCFLTHRDTSSEVAIWRLCSSRILVVAFRGTSDVLDVLTDVNLIQTPLEQGFQGQESDDPRKVHSGFFASARAINRRLKEILVAACVGTPGDWSLLITGHSLGGALASLMAPDLIGKVDVSRGFKERPDASWWGQAQAFGQDLFSSVQEAIPGSELPRFATVKMYTFGAPRVGNSEFARYFDETFGPDAYRIVNGLDVVPRLPRDGNAAGAVLDYEHVGRTVLITEDADEASGFNGFWIEGTSDDANCPLRDASPLSNPFSSGELLGDVGKEAMGFAAQTWEKIDAAAKGKSRSQLQAAVAEATEELARTRESITSRMKQVSSNPLEVVSMIGLDKDFVESEVKLAESLVSGKAIEHHLEPSYFLAMIKALDAALGKDSTQSESQT